MKLSLSDESKLFMITAYDEGEFKIKGKVYPGSHIIWPDKPPLPWQLENIEDLNQASFDSIKSENVETIILGTGRKLVFPDDRWLVQFYQQSVGFEIMDTAAACRTYNILVSEGRNILAALIPV